MCGIGGYIGLNLGDSSRRILESLASDLAHRGPDATGMYVDDTVGLVHRRLSIIDLSDAANQPFRSLDQTKVLIFNGELYNYRELRDELHAKWDFRTSSDTEVVLAALAVWGSSALQRFNGMFALAYWDENAQELLLARDRVGIKPLYYAETNGGYLFSSEIRSILNTGLVKRKLNSDALSEYLMYQTVHEPNTIITGIKMLEAGTYMRITDSEVTSKRYWQPWSERHIDAEKQKVEDGIRIRFVQSVERRLVSDVPFGAFLSGGIDSSLVVAVMSGVLGHKVSTFNVSFDESEYSEAKYARSIAAKYGTDHHEILLKPERFLESLPDAMSSIDHPTGDGPNSWIVSRETKNQGITMALSGLGGDELFAGYDVFTRLPSVADKNWLLSFPKGLRSMVGQGLKAIKPGIASNKAAEILKLDYFNLEELYPVFRKSYLPSQVRQMLSSDVAVVDRVQAIVRDLEEYEEFGSLPVLSRISIAEMKTYMQSVLLRDTDQMSMAHALEVRVPFLDHELIEYATHVGDSLKYPHSPKKLLIDSFKDLLPADLVNRRKMGFVLPWEHWMRGPLESMVDDGLTFLKDSGKFNSDALTKIYSDFRQEKPVMNWSRIWMLVSLSDWLRRHEIE